MVTTATGFAPQEFPLKGDRADSSRIILRWHIRSRGTRLADLLSVGEGHARVLHTIHRSTRLYLLSLVDKAVQGACRRV
jgi:hypothetical protein